MRRATASLADTSYSGFFSSSSSLSLSSDDSFRGRKGCIGRACWTLVAALCVVPIEGMVSVGLSHTGNDVRDRKEVSTGRHDEHEQETCTIDVVLPFSVEELEDKESYGYGKWTAALRNSISVAHMAAALLAYEHWITGDCIVVPELQSERLRQCRHDGRVLKAVTGLRFIDSVIDAHNHGGGGDHGSSHHANHREKHLGGRNEDEGAVHLGGIHIEMEETEEEEIAAATSRTTQPDGEKSDRTHQDLHEGEGSAEEEIQKGQTDEDAPEGHTDESSSASSPHQDSATHHHGRSHDSGHHNSEYMAELRQLAQESILHESTPCAVVGCADPNAIQAYGLLASLLNVPHVFLDATLPLLLASSAVIPYSVANTVPMETLADSLLEYLQRGKSLKTPREYIAIIVDESEYGSFMGGYFETLAQHYQDLTIRLEVVNKDDFEDSTELVLDRIQKYGFRTLIMAVQHHDILYHVAEVAATKEMIGPDVLWMFVDETMPLQFITDVLTHEPHNSPIARLVQGAGVIQILDGFMYDKHHPFLKSWHAQNATFVEKVNSFVAPLVSLKTEKESEHHQSEEHGGGVRQHEEEEHREGHFEEHAKQAHQDAHDAEDVHDDHEDDGSHEEEPDEGTSSSHEQESHPSHLLPDDYFQTTEPFLHSTFVYDAIMAVLMSYCHLTLPPHHDHHAFGEVLGAHLEGEKEHHGMVEAEGVLSNRGDRIIPLLHETSFHGASGLVAFEDRSRRRDSMVLGIYNIQPRRWRKHNHHQDHPHNNHHKRREGEHEEKTPATSTEHHDEGHHDTELAGFDAVLTFIKHGNKGWEPAVKHNKVPFLYFSGSSDEPMPVIKAVEQNHLSPVVRWIGLSLMISCLLVSAISMSWTIWRRKDSIVKSAQPEFIYILCIGSMTSALTILALSFDESYGLSEAELNAACAAAPWLFHVGYIASYCAISSKLWRIHRLLQFRRKNVNFRHVLLPFAALLTAALAVLVLWTATDKLHWSRTVVTDFPRETVGRCSSDSLAAFNACLVVLEVASTALAVGMAWIARDINERFSESKWIFNAVCAQLQAWLIGIPLVLVLERSSTDAYFMAYSLLIWVFSVTSVTLVVGPRMFQWYQQRRHRHQRRTSSAGQGSDGNNNENHTLEQGRVHISGIITLKPDNRYPSDLHDRSRVSSSEADDVVLPVTNPHALRRSSLRSAGTMTNCSTAVSTNERRSSVQNGVAALSKGPEMDSPTSSASSSACSPAPIRTGDFAVPSGSDGESTLVCRRNSKTQQWKDDSAESNG